jgi:hypothetical protein
MAQAGRTRNLRVATGEKFQSTRVISTVAEKSSPAFSDAKRESRSEENEMALLGLWRHRKPMDAAERSA